MSCGCHIPNEDHGDPRNITLADLQDAADAAGITLSKAAGNIVRTLQSASDAKVWTFDIDKTITAAPEQFARLATALQESGDRVIVVTGHGTKQTREELLDALGFPYDEIMIVDPEIDGSGKAKALKRLGAYFHFDDRIEFGPSIIDVCPVTFQFRMPMAGDPQTQVFKAAKNLRGREVLLDGGPHDGARVHVSGLARMIVVDESHYTINGQTNSATFVESDNGMG